MNAEPTSPHYVLPVLDSEIARAERVDSAQACTASLAEFTRQAWHVVEHGRAPDWGWHLDAICLHLEAVKDAHLALMAGEPFDPTKHIRKALFNIAPRHLKSTLVSVMFPAWMWLHDPGWRGLFGSYDDGLAIRDCVRTRDVVDSTWYRETFRPAWELKGDQNQKRWFENTEGGLRFAWAMNGRGTGFGGHCVAVDDPHNVKHHPTPEDLEKARFVWQVRMANRLDDAEKGARLAIMQRTHEGDLAGRWLVEEPDVVRVSLPTEFNPDERCETPIGWRDPRTEPGELLFPQRFDADANDAAKTRLGPYQYAAQHGQRPTPEGGGIIKETMVCYWYDPDLPEPRPIYAKDENGDLQRCEQKPLPFEFDLFMTSWDFAFKDTAGSSKVAGGAWAWDGPDAYWLDLTKGRWDFFRSLVEFGRFEKRWHEADGHLVEDKANGPAVMSMVRRRVPGVVEVNPGKIGGKRARTHACLPLWAASNVWVPHPDQVPWVAAAVEQITKYPFFPEDDVHDQMTQALNWRNQQEEIEEDREEFVIV